MKLPEQKSPRRRTTTISDRFIPPACSDHMTIARHILFKADRSENTDILLQNKVDCQRMEFRTLLELTMCPQGIPDKIVMFHLRSGLSGGSPLFSPWPVKPRPRRYVCTPDCVLDLPDFRPSVYVNVLAWGGCGLLAAGLGRSVFLCDVITTFTERLTTFSTGSSTAVCYDGPGGRLATANSASQIQVWDVFEKKLVLEVTCHCFLHGGCSINALSWHPKGKRLFSGCSRGVLSAMTVSEELQRHYQVIGAHQGQIAKVLSSPNGSYVASCGEDGKIRVWTWATLAPHMEIVDHEDPVLAIAWHPWHASYLAVGSRSLSVYNVGNCDLVAQQYFEGHLVTVFSLEWSIVTGELVVSVWVHGDGRTEVLVLATLDKVVDRCEMRGNPSRVQYLLWGPDGTKLATAGPDETLRIWNFIKLSGCVKKNENKDDFGCIIR